MNEKDLILIGGKAYKKCRVVMLPTKKVTKAGYDGDNFRYFGTVYQYQNPVSHIKFQHLYILSNEEIREVELNTYHYIETKGIVKITGEVLRDFSLKNLKKYLIIATTDKSLTIPDSTDGVIGGYSIPLPKPSDDFIKAYCKAHGKIEEVLIEYGYCESYVPDISSFYTLKTAPDNTIVIKKVELSIEEAAKKFTLTHPLFLNDTTNTEKFLAEMCFQAGVEWRDKNPK